MQGIDGAAPISDEEALGELERVLGDPAFRISGRNQKFLRYIVMETLAGRGDAIKAYSIAVDVFGRPSSFDPMTDPVVRIEASRLRTSLENGYEAQPHTVRIEIPKGRYVAQFVRTVSIDACRSPEAGPTGSVSPNHRGLEDMRSQAPSRRSWKVGALALMTLLAGVLAYAGWRQTGSGSSLFTTARSAFLPVDDATNRHGADVRGSLPIRFSDKPVLRLEIEPISEWKADDTVRFHGELMASLSRFPTLRIAEASAEPNAPAVSAPAGSTAVSRTYRLLLKLEMVGKRYSARWRLLSESNELVQTGKQEADLSDDAQARDFAGLIPALSREIAGYGGAIPLIETRLDLNDPTLGNGCVQRALTAIGERLETIESSRNCLEQTLAAQPGNADVRAVLSLVILAAKPFEATAAERARALELARTAVSLAPGSERSSAALMIALYHARQIEAAIATGYHSIALNPNDYTSRVYLGWILFSSGRWKEGVDFIQTAQGKSPLARNFDAGATLLLDAYRRGSYSEVLDMMEKRPYQRPYLALLTLIATFGQLGREEEAAAAIKAMQKLKPRFEKTFYDDMAARSMSQELVGALRTGLIKSGVIVP